MVQILQRDMPSYVVICLIYPEIRLPIMKMVQFPDSNLNILMSSMLQLLRYGLKPMGILKALQTFYII
jgi:hypothetical protein